MVELLYDVVRNSNPNPVRKYLWKVVLPEADSMISARVQGVKFPMFKVKTETIQVSPSIRIEVPEEVEYGDVSLDVIENADMKTYAYFKRWHDLMKNADGTFNPRQKYVKSAYIQLLNTDDMILRQFTVEEAWVKEIDALDLDYKNNDFLVFGVVLSCVRIS